MGAWGGCASAVTLGSVGSGRWPVSTIFSDECATGAHEMCDQWCDCPCHAISPQEQAAITARLAEVDAMLAEAGGENP